MTVGVATSLPKLPAAKKSDVATPAGRAEWLVQVEAETAAWREWRASEYERRGERHVQDADADTLDKDGPIGATAVAAAPLSLWHVARAKATRERFDRVRACDTLRLRRRCGCHTQEIRMTCDHWRLCYPCQRRRQARYRALFSAGREQALKAKWREMRTFSKGGRWTEKMLTLTVPASESYARDVEELARAWPRFRAKLGAALKERGVDSWRDVPYWRALEIAGRPHYHVWMLCPYVAHAEVARWWAESLSADYRDALPDSGAIVWLSAAKGDVGKEMSKYLVKDFLDNGERMCPSRFARIYAALDGVRCVATSVGFVTRKVSGGGWCPCCGEVFASRIIDAPLSQAPVPEKPPPLRLIT